MQGDEAVLLRTIPQRDEFWNMRFVKEDGRWKIKDFVFSDKAYPAEAVYAMISPPREPSSARGRRGRTSCRRSMRRMRPSRAGRCGRLTMNRSCIFGIDSSTPGSLRPAARRRSRPVGWPVMKVGVSSVGEFVLHATANIGDQATFDKSGRANAGHRHFVSYWLMLEPRRPDDFSRPPLAYILIRWFRPESTSSKSAFRCGRWASRMRGTRKSWSATRSGRRACFSALKCSNIDRVGPASSVSCMDSPQGAGRRTSTRRSQGWSSEHKEAAPTMKPPSKGQAMSSVPLWFERKFDFTFPIEYYPNLRMRLWGTPGRLEELVRGVPHHVMIEKTAGKWSAQEHAGHLTDLEPLWLARVEDFLADVDTLTIADPDQSQNRRSEPQCSNVGGNSRGILATRGDACSIPRGTTVASGLSRD